MPSITNWWGVGYFFGAMFLVPVAGVWLHRHEKRASSTDPNYNPNPTNPKETTHG